MKRIFDIALACVGLVLFSPVLFLCALAVALGDGLPLLYRARRYGRGGTLFTMYKFRTMRRTACPPSSVITSWTDARVFPAGRLLRKWKVDELPQLVNILKGEMSFVGPRPEDPKIVDAAYTEQDRALQLSVRPGLASPGTLYNYTHGEPLLHGAQAERIYIEEILPLRLTLDAVYVERQGLLYDVRLIARTLMTIVRMACGQSAFEEVCEMAEIGRCKADQAGARNLDYSRL